MTAPRRWLRSTIRARLTFLYAGAFFLAGAVLVAVMYFVLGQALDRQQAARVGATEHLAEATATDADSLESAHQAQEALRAQFRQDRDDTLDTMLVASLIALGVIGVIAGGFGWLLAARALHPLQRITATARRVADRNLHERIGLEGPDDEIMDLADTFDSMLERLDRSFDGQRRFVANASHELRTPLTINRTLVEVALDDPEATEPVRRLGAHLLAVNERNERLIDGLLTLASTDHLVSDPTRIDLADIARHVIDESRDAARAAGIDIQANLQPAPTMGDPELLERLTQNLLDNAVRYNVPHGKLTVATNTVDGNAILTVENTGQPVAPYQVPSLFEPFHRLPTTERLADPAATSPRRGAGLGLSIVRSVAHAHGGDVQATPREGGGLTVRVRLEATVTGDAGPQPA